MQTKQTVKIANGSKYFMRRKDSYMVEVCGPAEAGFSLWALIGRNETSRTNFMNQ